MPVKHLNKSEKVLPFQLLRFLFLRILYHVCVYEIENKPPKGMDFCLDFLTALFLVPRIVAYWKRP